MQRQIYRVVILSAAGLFLELLLIRWLDAQVRCLAYFKNLPLIASFLGLGIGFAISKNPRDLYRFAIVISSITLFIGSLQLDRSLAGPFSPQINMGMDPTNDTIMLWKFYSLVTLLFVLIVLCMVPIGQITGRSMQGIASLKAYAANILGAILGITVFFALNAFSLAPWISAALVLFVLFLYLPRERRFLLPSGMIAFLTCGQMFATDFQGESRTVWSPYNKIEIAKIPNVLSSFGREISPGWNLRVQNIYYQRVLDLRTSTVAEINKSWPMISRALYAYNYPYHWKHAKNVLIVGAGTGNDVAAALRNAAERVDAVEIDPMILEFGRILHAERPYSDSRVRVHVEDARTFFRSPGPSYDLIVFGLLDAQTSIFSTLSSNIRLDNYVYTVESLQQALRRLSPDGILSLSFYGEKPWVVGKLCLMLQKAWGRPPLVAPIYYDYGHLLLAGPGVGTPPAGARFTVGLTPEFLKSNPPGPVATDAWPFLYLSDRVIPATIVYASLAIIFLSAILVWIFFRHEIAFDRHLFFLGAAFLLVETRTIAQLDLFYGATWRVSAITIALILSFVLIGNLIIQKIGKLPLLPLYCALAITLIGNYLVPTSIALDGTSFVRFAFAVFLLLPVFFASLIFSSSISKAEHLESALASNLIGSVLGGVLENLALLIGFPALSLVALGLYLSSVRR